MTCLLIHSSNITLYQQQQPTAIEETKAILQSSSSSSLLADAINTPTAITTTVSVDVISSTSSSSSSSALLTPPITPTSNHASSILSTPSYFTSSLDTLSLLPSIPTLVPPPSPPPLPTATATTIDTIDTILTTSSTLNATAPDITTPTSTSSKDVSLSTLIPIAATTQLSNIEDSPSKEPAYYTLSTGIQKAIRDMKLGKSQARNLHLEWHRLAKLIPIKKGGRTRVIAMAGWFEHRDKAKTVNLEKLETIVADLRKQIFALKEEEFMNMLFEKRKSGTKDQIVH